MQVKSDGEDIGQDVWSSLLSSACYVATLLAWGALHFP